jgi:hypothetical protein
MDGRFPFGWVLVVSTLAAYLFLATLLTGGAKLPVGVLLAVLVLWFAVYRVRHRRLGNKQTARRMYSDFKGVIESMAERMRAADERAREAAAAHDEWLARMERSRGERVTRTEEDPAVGRYAQMIERRVREAQAARRGDEEGEPSEESSDRP